MKKGTSIKKEKFFSRIDDYIDINFKNSLKEIYKIRIYIWFSFMLFVISGMIGFFLPIFFVDEILKFIEELVKKTAGLSPIELINFIISNNIEASFIALIFGIILGIFPIITSVVNGYVLGFVANKAVIQEGILVLWRLLPHGIFEIPGVLISIALGIKIGFSIIQDSLKEYNPKISDLATSLIMVLSIILFPIGFLVYTTLTIVNKNLRKKFIRNLLTSIKVFIFVVIPLIVIAGIIEGIFIWLLG